MANNAQHVYFVQKKKAEILAKKEREKMLLNAPKPDTPTVNKVEAPKLKFANDGSFLERFKEMQRQQQLLSKSPSSSPSSSSSVSTNLSNTSAIPSTNLTDAEKLTLKMSATKTQTELKLTTKSQPELKVPTPASIFKQDDEEADGYQPSEYDLARELAKQVADGIEVEAVARNKYQGDSRYRFLLDPSSPVAHYYQSQLRLFKPAAGKAIVRKRRWNENEDDPSNTSESLPQSSSSDGASSPQGSQNVPTANPTVNPIAEFEKAKALMKAKAAALTGGIAPVMTEEDKKRAKAIEEQKMMNELYRKVIEQQALFAQMASRKAKAQGDKGDKPKYEYDSDEDTEGGTWEHKKRKLEMKKTEEWAGDLTEQGRGKHHLSDFLPPEELEKFMENVKAVQEGRSADISDYAKFKIQADNVGFQLLQKSGWVEGTGLGSKGEGIVQPINKGKTSFEQAGVGTEMPQEVTSDDNEFDLYRKRMMLSYKFRPNPLNNPRRPYY